MSRPKNEVIGECECPHKGCSEKCQVFRFRQRGEGRVRFAGKLYADCPVHGRYGADGKQAAQEYILENATIWGDAKRPVKDEPSPDPAPEQNTSPPPSIPALGKPAVPEVSPPVPASQAKPPKWWEALQPVIK